ncbi:MarR family transcriptional regulator [Streptomyces sp. ICBB 8177]|uniref:MarR family winged helix-turn-helix transcriptional regulator n=1 Tax=Streptomyces sp. ICBB 8177 TaxID=563922 RepID=UPI000D67FBDC|nr:MarR family transcriptional regulator [Streptomyces sp. ICBB 8177]PWI41867.1 MarR family transcriptional regulator [Streptomyces sp. ICBB 8177]
MAVTDAPHDVVETTDPAGTLADQLLRLTRRTHRTQKRHLEPLGITPAMSRLLRAASHGEQPQRMVDLAQRLDVVPRAVTTLVDGLEAAGLVRRVADPANRRVVRVEVTAEGEGVLRRLREARRAAIEEILAPLDADQRAQLGALLTALDAGAERHPEG